MGFEFIADRPCLDFVSTLAERGSTDAELLRSPHDLVAWAAQSGLVDDLQQVTPRQLARAQEAREAMFGVIAGLIDGSGPSDLDREVLNRTAALRGRRLKLSTDGSVSRTGGFTALLAVLALDCIDLCDSPDRQALRSCADARCTRPFVDRSRGQRRRWCGMKGCGDRAKAAAYRRRKRRGEGDDDPRQPRVSVRSR